MVVVNSLAAELSTVAPRQHLNHPDDGVVVMQQPVYSMDYATGRLYVQRLEPVVYAPRQIVSKQ